MLCLDFCVYFFYKFLDQIPHRTSCFLCTISPASKHKTTNIQFAFGWVSSTQSWILSKSAKLRYFSLTLFFFRKLSLFQYLFSFSRWIFDKNLPRKNGGWSYYTLSGNQGPRLHILFVFWGEIVNPAMWKCEMQCCREFLMCKKFESANSDLNGRRSEKREGLAKPCVTCAKLSHLHIEDIKSALQRKRRQDEGVAGIHSDWLYLDHKLTVKGRCSCQKCQN